MQWLLWNFLTSSTLLAISISYMCISDYKGHIRVYDCSRPRREIPLILDYIIGNFTRLGGTKRLTKHVQDSRHFKAFLPSSYEEIFPFRRADGLYDFIDIRGPYASRLDCPIGMIDINGTGFSCYDVTVPDPATVGDLTNKSYSSFNCQNHLRNRTTLVSTKYWTEIRKDDSYFFHLPEDHNLNHADIEERQMHPFRTSFWKYVRILFRAIRETANIAWIKTIIRHEEIPSTWAEFHIAILNRVRDLIEMLSFHFLMDIWHPGWDIGEYLYFWVPDWSRVHLILA